MPDTTHQNAGGGTFASQDRSLPTPEGESEGLRDFGQHLKRERELRGISLEEIAQVTRINRRYLVAIEEGWRDKLPADPFVKGFVAAYAKHIGLAPDDVLTFFEEVNVTGAPEPEEADEGRTGRRHLWMWVASLAAVIALVAYLAVRPGVEEPAAPPVRPVPEAPSAPVAPEELPAPQVEEAPLPERGVRLVLEARERSWIYAVIDEGSVKDFLMEPGEEADLQALASVSLTLGNAGGVTVTFNGRRLESLGKPGEVKRDILFRNENEEGPKMIDPFGGEEAGGQ